MKITQSEFDVQKELGLIHGTRFDLQEIMSPLAQRTYVKPRLLTVLMSPVEEFSRTKSFEFDLSTRTVQLPSGKAYHEHGPDLKVDQPDMRFYAIPSFGVRFNVRPEDADGQRKPGTMELLTPEDIVAELTFKMAESWDLFEELALAQLITTDTNIVRGGPFTSYNFYTDIVGSARPAATSMQLATTTVDHAKLARKEQRLLRQELEMAGLSAGQTVVICGDNFFDQRFEIEKNIDLNRPLKWGPDFASSPQTNMDIAGFNYAYFDSMDGLRYINYGSEIIAGSKLIDDDMAYMIPTGVNVVTKAYAPAQRLSTINRTPQRRYVWQETSDVQGYNVWAASNVLYMNKFPRVIRHLTV